MESQQVRNANVNGSRLQAFAFPLPQVAAQVQNVADGADKPPQIEPTENAVDRHPLRSTRLHQCGMKQAFEGKLVRQDPTEEPARLLLERLRASRSENDENSGTQTTGRPENQRNGERMVDK